MKAIVLLLATALIARAAETAARPFEDKISAVSPDKKFAMRIRHDPGSDGSGEIDSASIQAIDLVALPSRTVISQLLPSDDAGMTINDIRLVWSSDSQWCAFYYAFPRVGYTAVLHRNGDSFVTIGQPEDLMVDATAGDPDATDVRNEYISPVKWTKPGTLLLDQFSILRTKSGEPSDARFRLTAVYDAAANTFKVTSKRKSGE